jgi:hypothetical protein
VETALTNEVLLAERLRFDWDVPRRSDRYRSAVENPLRRWLRLRGDASGDNGSGRRSRRIEMRLTDRWLRALLAVPVPASSQGTARDLCVAIYSMWTSVRSLARRAEERRD